MVPEAGWLSEETVGQSRPPVVPAMWVRRSDRRHARFHARPARLGGVGGAGRAMVPVSWRARCAGARRIMGRAAGPGRYCCNGETLRASRRTTFDGARVPADSLPKIDRDLVMVDQAEHIALRIAMVAAGRGRPGRDLALGLRMGYRRRGADRERGRRDGNRRVRPAAHIQHAARAGLRRHRLRPGNPPGRRRPLARPRGGSYIPILTADPRGANHRTALDNRPDSP